MISDAEEGDGSVAERDGLENERRLHNSSSSTILAGDERAGVDASLESVRISGER